MIGDYAIKLCNNYIVEICVIKNIMGNKMRPFKYILHEKHFKTTWIHDRLIPLILKGVYMYLYI